VKKEGREEAGRGGIRAVAPGRLAARRGRRKGERERLTSGAQVSASAEKKKKGRLGGPLAGESGGPAGLAGPKGEK
jgi:hypothetical protein